MRIKTLQLGYTLPKTLTSKWDFSRIHAYIGGDNLFTITKYNGFDPEVNIDRSISGVSSYGIDYLSYPKAKSIIFGLNFSF
jgi:iron complex outermembrane receptor protein